MKRKIELVCWILFTLCSGICFFINFMSKPPVDDTHKFTLYMIGAATVSLLYPGTMFILGLRNSYLYDKLNKRLSCLQMSLSYIYQVLYLSGVKDRVSIYGCRSGLISYQNCGWQELFSFPFMKLSDTGKGFIHFGILYSKR